jgi:hypothetical protein
VEVLVTLLLVVGAYALGMVSSPSRAVEAAHPLVVEVAPPPKEAPQQAVSDECRYAEGPLPQRDLTVPYPMALPDPEQPAEHPLSGCRDE